MFIILSSILNPFYVNANSNANDISFPSPIQVDQVNHVIHVRYGGLVVINDTIQLSTNNSESVLLHNFTLGFPHKYESNLCYCDAYNLSNPDETFKTTLDSRLQTEIGYYGINVIFQKQGAKITQNKPFNLTVATIFSNLVSSTIKSRPTEPEEGEEIKWENVTEYWVDFPKYPSLQQKASEFVGNVILPERTRWENTTLVEDFYSSYEEDAAVGNYTKAPLNKFMRSSGSLSFTMAEGSEGSFSLINVNKLERELKIGDSVVSVSDSYHLSNRATQSVENLSSVALRLPSGAHNITAFDQFGKPLPSSKQPTTLWNKTFVTLDSPVKENESTKFKLTYRLSWEEYISRKGWDQFNLSLTLFDEIDLLVNDFTLTIHLPEGAEITGDSPKITPDRTYYIHKDIFQEKISLTFHGVTPLTPVHVNLAYQHPVLWASFRPTLWVAVLVAIGCAVALVWQAPKPSTPVIRMPVRPRALKNFVETYEEKTTVLSRLESLRAMGRKGKISRRQFKVKRRMLERQASKLSKDLDKLWEKIRAVGSGYAETMNQFEVAEAKLETVKRDIRRIKSQYRRGELSIKAYRRLLEEYKERRNEVESLINGIMIRLREEIR